MYDLEKSVEEFKLEYSLKWEDDDVVVLDMVGYFTGATCHRIRPTIESLLDGQGKGSYTVFDLTDVREMDASGFGCIVTYFKLSKKKKASAAVVAGKKQEHQPAYLMGLLGTDKVIPVYPTREDALQRTGKRLLGDVLECAGEKPESRKARPDIATRIRKYVGLFMKKD